MAIVFDPLDEEYQANPQNIFSKLRKDHPCYWSPEANSWVLSRYDDCKEVLRNTSVFARDPARAGLEKPERTHSIQTEDPPVQQILRQRLLRALHAQDLDEIANEGLNTLVQKIDEVAVKEVDILCEVISPAVMSMIAKLLGVDGLDYKEYLEHSTNFSRGMDAGLDRSRLRAAQQSGNFLRDKVETWFTIRPENGLMSLISEDSVVQGELKNRGNMYMKNTIAGIFNAGYSTSLAICASILELYQKDADVLVRAKRASNISIAAEELIRFISPAQATARIAISPYELHGKKISAGDTVITLLASANHDESRFSNPETIDFERENNQHLGFAWGPHVCLGARLAIAWVSCLILRQEEWLDKLEIREINLLDSATLRTYKSIKGIKING